VVLWRFLFASSVRKVEKGKLVSVFGEAFLWWWDAGVLWFRVITENVKGGSGRLCYNR
jgi:hypothetical protein